MNIHSTEKVAHQIGPLCLAIAEEICAPSRDEGGTLTDATESRDRIRTREEQPSTKDTLHGGCSGLQNIFDTESR